MHPAIKILFGTFLTVAGIFLSISFSDRLLDLTLGAIGPLLVLIGAFIVWLESDEWKLQKEERSEKTTNKNLQDQFQTLKKERENLEATKESFEVDYEKILSGTVNEVKERVANMENPDYERLMELEKDGKDRKTLLRHLQRQT